jgi:hypothetical protein
VANEGCEDPSDDRIVTLPKPELHVHLDGSLRPETMLALARERDVDLPAADSHALAAAMRVPRARGLEAYLERFDLTLLLMQDAEALERIAYELAADCAAETVPYVEVRFCPVLCTTGGLAPDEVLDAALRGLARARIELGVVSATMTEESVDSTWPAPRPGIRCEGTPTPCVRLPAQDFRSPSTQARDRGQSPSAKPSRSGEHTASATGPAWRKTRAS